MRLKASASLQTAETDLRDAINMLTTAQSGRPHEELWKTYLTAVDNVLPRLAQSFAEPDLAGGLLSSPTYWHLFRGDGGPSELTRAASREAEAQLAVLNATERELQELKKLAEQPGVPVVVDTNVLLHWSQPGDVRWREVWKAEGVEAPATRLVVPLVVIDELDKQKYGEGRLAKRAATAIRYLDRTLRDFAPGATVELAAKVTLEVRVDSLHRTEVDADMRILMCAAELDQLAPKAGTRVLTNDTNMRLRALHMELKTMSLPEEYRKPGTAMSCHCAAEEA